MTADGSEEAAAEAMRGGAANFVPKRHIRQELPQVLGQVLTAARTDRAALRTHEFHHAARLPVRTGQ